MKCINIMPKIAIILIHTYRQHEDSYSLGDAIVEHITEWTEVTRGGWGFNSPCPYQKAWLVQ